MPSPDARQIGASIAALLRLFQDKVPDAKSNASTLQLATNHEQWLEARALHDVVRDRLLGAKDEIEQAHYSFEESCLEALSHELEPDDPVDSVSPYWVVASGGHSPPD